MKQVTSFHNEVRKISIFIYSPLRFLLFWGRRDMKTIFRFAMSGDCLDTEVFQAS